MLMTPCADCGELVGDVHRALRLVAPRHFTPKEWPERVAPRVQCNWTRVQVFVRSRTPAGATAQALRAEECANTYRPLHTAVPGLFAHHHQGIYIARYFDKRSADARLAWNGKTPTNINALMMVIEAPSAAADGAQHIRGSRRRHCPSPKSRRVCQH